MSRVCSYDAELRFNRSAIRVVFNGLRRDELRRLARRGAFPKSRFAEGRVRLEIAADQQRTGSLAPKELSRPAGVWTFE